MKMTSWNVLLCTSDSGTLATMDSSTAPVSQEADGAVGSFSSSREELEQEEEFASEWL